MNTSLNIVLVRPEGPVNIGLSARACENFGAKLSLVEPKKGWYDETAKTFASKAQSTLRHAPVYTSLNEAVTSSHQVIGMTARSRTLRKPSIAYLQPPPQTLGQTVHLVLGNERNGLNEAEAAQCHHLVSLPSDENYPSLNLSHAVAVTLAWWKFTGQTNAPKESATHIQKRFLLEAFVQTLEVTSYFQKINPARFIPKLQSLLDTKIFVDSELNLLHGILKHFRAGQELSQLRPELLSLLGHRVDDR